MAVIALAPAGRRRAAAGWWFAAALAGGGYWYLRNLIAAGNPLPQVEHLGPIDLPHPERLQSGRPDHSILHYATDTSVWHEYFTPGLHEAFGALWPLVVLGAVAGPIIALAWGRDRVLRWIGAVVIVGFLAYLVTPLGAAGAEGEPVGFAINIRFALPAMLAGAALLPLAPWLEGERRQWIALVALLAVLVVTDRADTVLRDPSRPFGLLVAALAVLIPAALIFWLARRPAAPGRGGHRLRRARPRRRRGRLSGPAPLPRRSVRAGLGNPRDGPRFRLCLGPRHHRCPDRPGRQHRGLPRLRLLRHRPLERRHLSGLSGPHGAFNAIPTCSEFRAAVNDADLDYLVTAPFLNYIHTDEPVRSPEAGWLRGEPAVRPVLRNGEVTVWRVDGRLDPAACGPENAPLRRSPSAARAMSANIDS